MGWHISLIENTIEINEAVASDLFALQEAGQISSWPWHDLHDVMEWGGTKLDFNPDHLEHMDFLWEEEIQNVLKKHKIRGIATFGSLSGGDDDGKFWGYEFDGDGGMTELKGELVWEKK